ncbi:hypothetical protein [Rhizohabitans arisaemae]|uniref:hypothetical protein n=1 Tax=Rhizohabitans arisaemae TaxID=2720610 RepID=UPI0024B14860|nr:hypothetical protein [Rhizohabitans arisaemae]
MSEPIRITDIRAAMAERTFPTVTVWNRVEGRPRTTEFGRALRAEVRDALWQLTRQWQFGEFRGEDAGSPVTAQYHLNTTRPTRFRAGDAPPADLPGDPLEAVVERRPVPFTVGADPVSLDLRLILGRRWLKMIHRSLRDEFTEHYAIKPPDPAAAADTAIVSDPQTWAGVAAVAGRAMDGYLLYRHLKAGGRPYDGMHVPHGHKDELDEAAPLFVAWFEGLITQPGGPAAWDPQRLEHRFALGAPTADGERVLTAEEYPGGRLDWHAFSIDTDAPPLGAADPSVRASVTRTVLPGPVGYSGMPHPRFWAFEDGRTNFGAITPDTTDLARLLFCEFALVFSNDWFLLPCDLPAGTLAALKGLAVTDVFGQRFWITPAGSGADDDWQRWSMFNLTIAGTAPVTADTGVFLPASVPKTAEGPPLEEVVLIRDENANMVWGVERTVPIVLGEGRRGAETAAETLAHRRRLLPPVTPPEPAAVIAYEAMNTVPENWIPFIPVHLPGDNREIQLQRAALPRVLPGGPVPPEKVRPRTSLLRDGLDVTPQHAYFVHEEEVPRAGTRVVLAFNRTRGQDGRPVVWLSAHRTTGRGEGSSGLAFDRIADTPPAP